MEKWKVLTITGALSLFILLSVSLYMNRKETNDEKMETLIENTKKPMEVTCNCPPSAPDHETIKSIVKNALREEIEKLSGSVDDQESHRIQDEHRNHERSVEKVRQHREKNDDMFKKSTKKKSITSPILNPPVSGRLAMPDHQDEEPVMLVTDDDIITRYDAYPDDDFAEFHTPEDYKDVEHSRGEFRGGNRGIPDFSDKN